LFGSSAGGNLFRHAILCHFERSEFHERRIERPDEWRTNHLGRIFWLPDPRTVPATRGYLSNLSCRLHRAVLLVAKREAIGCCSAPAATHSGSSTVQRMFLSGRWWKIFNGFELDSIWELLHHRGRDVERSQPHGFCAANREMKSTNSIRHQLAQFSGSVPRRSNEKQSCNCGHSKTIHRVGYGIMAAFQRYPCRHPRCVCNRYTPLKPAWPTHIKNC
jgi:hypothetical protein